MKNKFIYAVCVMAVTMFCACGPDPEPGPMAEPLGHSVYVVKLAKPEYKDLVLVERSSHSGYEACCFNRCAEPAGKAGCSPYWELPNGWLLVDWKWTGFYGFKYSATALTKQTWDKYEGLDTKGNPKKWLLTEPHTKENAVEEFQEIVVPCLENYSHAHYGENAVRLLKQYFACQHTRNISMRDNLDQMDSIWTILQRDLSAAIEKGELNEIGSQYEPESDSYWWN